MTTSQVESENTMTVTSWIRNQFSKRRTAPSVERPSDDVLLYLRRLEDRRVLSVTAVADAYFVDEFSSSLFAPAQLGVLSNDFDSTGGPLQTTSQGTILTDQGGTVELFSNGSFEYFSPFPAFSYFVDQFSYSATNGSEFSSQVDVTIFVGEVPIQFEQPTLLPIFGVESETPLDFVDVTLFSGAGGSLTFLDPGSVVFTFGQNGDSDISISGSADEINAALDTLEYTPPAGFFGFDDLFFDSFVVTGGQPPPPGEGPPPPPGGGGPGGGPPPPPPPPGGGGPPPGESFFQYVPVFVEPPDGGQGPGPGGGTIVAVDDQYYVDPAQSTVFFSAAAGVISNDFSVEGNFIFAVSETITTDLGGTVNLNSDGSFTYTPPTLPVSEFVDVFFYFASDEGSFSNPGFVLLFVGDVPVPEDFFVALPLFTVETPSPTDFVAVDLTSNIGASLTLFNTFGITFEEGFNGGSSFVISGTAQDINFALDSLDYVAPLDFSGDDLVFFTYAFFDGRGTQVISQEVPIDVFPIADAPFLFVAPQPVDFLPGFFHPVNIDVFLSDVDGSEIPGFVVLDRVPFGVIPSAGLQSSIDPRTFFISPSELENLSFFIGFGAPASFTIDVYATSIETIDVPGAFGGPGGPLLPTDPFDLRFAISGQTLSFNRLPPPAVPPPKPPGPPPPRPTILQTDFVFSLGPSLSNHAPPPKLGDHHGKHGGPHDGSNGGPKDGPKAVAIVVESSTNENRNDSTTTVVYSADGPDAVTNDSITNDEKSNEQGRHSSEMSGIYVRKLGSDGPGQTARLPEELSDDYPRFMAFLKTLPNGDYVVYFKRGGQSHDQAAVRQVVVKVRVINHRLNPDPGEFKPPGEVAEPPHDPNAGTPPVTTERPKGEERAELSTSEWTPIAAGAWMAVIAGWKQQLREEARTSTVDRLMERFTKKRFRRAKNKQFS